MEGKRWDLNTEQSNWAQENEKTYYDARNDARDNGETIK